MSSRRSDKEEETEGFSFRVPKIPPVTSHSVLGDTWVSVGMYPEKAKQLESLQYELEQLIACRQFRYNSEGLVVDDERQREKLEDALLEAFLIHARVISSFLKDKKSKKFKDDIIAQMFVREPDGWIGKIREEWYKPHFKYWHEKIDKWLAHMTAQRQNQSEKEKWDLDKMSKALACGLETFLKDVNEDMLPLESEAYKRLCELLSELRAS